jgi:hypothetical protein
MSIRTGSTGQGARRHLDAALDEALRQTFPASDPFHIGRPTATEPPSRPVDRKAPRIDPGMVAGQRRAPRRRGTGR